MQLLEPVSALLLGRHVFSHGDALAGQGSLQVMLWLSWLLKPLSLGRSLSPVEGRKWKRKKGTLG